MDSAINFAFGTVSAGYGAGATVIALTAGHGTRFTAKPPPFNCVWWNSTQYPDPKDDPLKEIVRVTDVTGDVVTIVRGQEGIGASAKNSPGKTYSFANVPTAKMFEDIEGLVLTETDGFPEPTVAAKFAIQTTVSPNVLCIKVGGNWFALMEIPGT